MKTKSIVTALIIVGLIVGGVFFIKDRNFPGSATGSRNTTLKMKGSKNATVAIIEFSDFQCPACKRAQPALKELLKTYPKNISLTFKHFPLDGHLWAKVAHQAAECANQQGKFWEFHDKLFEEQSVWSGPKNPLEFFLRYARDLDLKLETFGACLADEKVASDVQADKEEGLAKKVRSTPTFFVNEERVVGPVQLQVKGEEIIREAMGLPPSALGSEPTEEEHDHEHTGL